MKPLAFLVLVGIIHGGTAVTHSLKYFYTGSSQVPNFPEFVAVGQVDDVEMIHYDSNTGKAEPKQDWVNKAADAQYWERQTGGLQAEQQTFKGNIDIAKQRFNQTGGVHVYQRMYGCEWDDETQEVTGYDQFGYDGEDLLALDLKTETWTAAKQQVVISKNKWDHNKGYTLGQKNYLNQICPEWLKKYVNYGKSSLMKTVPPSVSLLQKTSSSPVRCHATGFYPNRAVMFWRKNGQELQDDVVQGEILPNHDGSFQMSVELTSVKPEDWENCECVFQLSGVKDDFVTKLEKTKIKTNESSFTLIIIVVVAAVLALAIGAIGFFAYRKRNAKRPPSPVLKPDPAMQQLNPAPTV